MATVPLDEVVYFDVITSNPATNAVIDADAPPTFEVFEENTDTDIGIGTTMTKRTDKTGNYKGTFTASVANGFEVGKYYSVIASATVGGITGKCVALSFRVTLAETTVGTPSVTIQPNQSVNVTGWNSIVPPTIPTTGDIQSNAMNLTSAYDGAKTAMQAGTSVGLLAGQSVNTTGWGGATLPTAFEASNLPLDYLSVDQKLQLASGAMGSWYSAPSIPSTGDMTTVLTAYNVAQTTSAMTLAENQAVNVTGWNGAVLPTSFTASNLPADYLTANEQLQLASGAMGSWYTSPTGSVYTYVESVKSYGDTKWLTATGTFATNMPSEYLTANEQLQLASGAAGSWYSAPAGWATPANITDAQIYITDATNYSGVFAGSVLSSIEVTGVTVTGVATPQNVIDARDYILNATNYTGVFSSEVLANIPAASLNTGDITTVLTSYGTAKTTDLANLGVNTTGWNGAILPTSFAASNLPADYLTANEQLQLMSGAVGSWYNSPTGDIYTYTQSVKTYGDTQWLTATGTFATNLPVSYLSTNEALQLASGAAGSWYSAPSGWTTTGNLDTMQTYLLNAAHYSGKYPSDILDNVSIQSDATVDTTALVSGLLSETVNSTTYNTTDTFGWLLNKIRNIATKVGLMVSSPIAAITPVQDNLDIDLVQYDDYTVANGRSLYWTNSDGSWSAGDITSSTVDLHIADTCNTLILSKTGIVTDATIPQRVDVELLSAETALLTHAGEVYKYQLVISSTGDRETVVSGKISNTLAIAPS